MHHYSRLLANRITIDGEHELWDSLLGDHGDVSITIRHGGYCPCGRYVAVGRVCQDCMDAAEALMPTDCDFGRAAVVAFIVAALGAVVWFLKDFSERLSG